MFIETIIIYLVWPDVDTLPGTYTNKLEDLKVLKRSPDLLNNCKTGQGQLQLIMKHILFYHIWGLQSFWSSNLNNLTAQLFLRKDV